MSHDPKADHDGYETLSAGPQGPGARKKSVLTLVSVAVVVVGLGLVVRAVTAPEDGIPSGVLKPGACLDLSLAADGIGILRHPKRCTEPHLFQILSVEVMPEGPYPGPEELEDRADGMCGAKWDAKVAKSPYASSHRRTSLAPAEKDWPVDRTAICTLWSPEGPTSAQARLP
ncbi:hypothetical protein EDD29_2568 [Actinocorallia herbida]|uniref:Regulator of septum formation n=1 Tax=Actinocorallia herbida TaxID=58109 RepID=A0A3N1CUQ2_9ACTN|nr:hypothetical protein [Actinocorallia herbida]ROO85033.1 hypothetical protein EDD29_2568 [Actinocorallia herbida]